MALEPSAPTKQSPRGGSTQRAIKLSLFSLIAALPTHAGQRLPLARFKPTDTDSIRKFCQTGDGTGLLRKEGEEIAAGSNLSALLDALERADYLAVNRLFRKVPAYDRVIVEAEEEGKFPPSPVAGSATGWAVVLGAAYKKGNADTRFGLGELTEEQFERTVVRVHAELAQGEQAVLLYKVLDRVCSEGKLPAHEVLVSPKSSSSSSYLEGISPGAGIVVGGKLVGSLVRRTGRSVACWT